MNNLEENYKQALLSAEKQFRYLENVPNYQWTIVNNNKSIKIYTHQVGQEKSIKVVKELNSNEANLEHFYASLSTIEMRTKWCPIFDDLSVSSHPNPNISIIKAKISPSYQLQEEQVDNANDCRDIFLVEQTIKKRHHVQHISTSISPKEDNYFMALNIENRFDNARATIYCCQWNTLDSTLISTILTNLIELESFSWISQCDKAIKIQKSNYNQNNTLELDYTFTESAAAAKSDIAVDILSSKRRYQNHNRWHSGSWDPQFQDTTAASHQTLRKNKFLSSSSLFSTSTSSTSSPKLNPTRVMSSYPDKQPWLIQNSSNKEDELDEDDDEQMMTKSLKDELRIEVDHIPKLIISLPDNSKWSNKFAQLCVRCYKRPNNSTKSGYVIQILHPFRLLQYFKQDVGLGEEETMKLDDDDEEDSTIRVNLIMKISPDNRFIVNDNEWPIRTWNISEEDDEKSSSSSNNSSGDDGENDDIFVDGMENIDTHITPPPLNNSTLPLPPKLRLVPDQSYQSLGDTEKQGSTAVIDKVQDLNQTVTKETFDQTEPVSPQQQQQQPSLIAPEQKVKEFTAPGQQQTLNQKDPPQKITATKKVKDDNHHHNTSRSSSSNKLEIPSLPHDDANIDHEDEQDKVIQETIIPDNDPVALQKIYPQFSEYINTNYEPKPTTIQSPSKENGHVAIKKLEIANHPMGGFLSESTWKDCSIWDIKAVLESAGARKIWDNTFENTTFLHALTATSSIWHTKIKGAWPVNPRDYVCFHGQYTTSAYRIDLLSTSCIGDSFQYKPLPKEVSGYIRATMDVMGWRLECIDAQTASVKQVLVTQFPSWVINYITSRFLVQSCAAVQSARDYLESFGAPPSLESLSWALLVDLKHDHERKNWRVEYTRRTDSESKESSTERKSDSSTPPSTISVIRLDKRRWASGYLNRYSVVIDPPPSRVSALEKVSDPYGIWVTVEHDEEFIIPLRGKILVLIKPDQLSTSNAKGSQVAECHLNVNGVSTIIEKELRPTPTVPRKQSSFSESFLKDENVKEKEINALAEQNTSSPLKRQSTQASTTPTISEEDQVNNALDQLTVSPKDRAQAALSFLKQTDEQFGWTVISDNNKTGLRVSKKLGVKNTNITASTKKNNNDITNHESSVSAEILEETISPAKAALIVPEPYMIYKASKVIENFSVDEVTAVVTDIGNLRKTYDDTLEQINLVRQLDPGCRVISQSVKAIFPFKNREIYAASCLAHEVSTTTLPTSPSKRTLYIESSLPDFPIVNSKKTRGNLYMSGWILEAIDPYTTTINHPIPSMRVTYVTALDLGTSVPSYISNLAANNWVPKKIQSIESYLKSKGPPPFISQPIPALIFSNNTLSGNVGQDEAADGIEWLVINTNYDKDKHHYKVNSRVKLDAAKKKSITITNSPSTQKSTTTTTTTKAADEISVTPTASTSASLLSPIRRPSTHTISSPDIGSRRGSLPVSALPKKRIVPIASSSTTEIKEKQAPAPVSRSVTFLQATFDLCAFTKGYEIQAQLYDVSTANKRKNISGKLVLSISEPSFSHFIDGKKKSIKHTILIKAKGLSPPPLPSTISEYEFEFLLIPVREETLQIKSTQLTVSHVLGEDEDEQDNKKWNGIIMVNGVESQIGTDIALKSLQDETDVESISTLYEDSKSPISPLQQDSIETEENDTNSTSSTSDEEQDADGESSTTALQYMGGGVVATALGNVSAGVNNLGARMMTPFRAASNSFLLSNNNNNKQVENEEKPKLEKRLEQQKTIDAAAVSSDDEDIEYRKRGFSRQEKRKISGSTLHEVRLLRKSSDTMRKGMLLLLICLGLAVVFALLMLQPMLERYYASFTASSTVASLDKSIDKGIVRRLIQIPWFGGWDIQVIAVRRGNA